ncbi:MAG: EF2563 family selenium-dependent molybdenum hydroxylase system protein [Anaerolineae bacterium]|nr:MAG: EF2563 family selenium-dependent molybdenum hydroxylase system protein [Anaerolineae bacterium]
MRTFILIRGGGDLASGVALRLYHAGFAIAITELPQPLAVRRTVAFSEAVYEGTWTVEDVTAQHVETYQEFQTVLSQRNIPVLVDPDLQRVHAFGLQPAAIVDARLLKQDAPPLTTASPIIIGLGPGFIAGKNCHAVIETQRGHTLGRVYWNGPASPNSGLPEGDPRRVLRAPQDGLLIGHAQIGEHLEPGQTIAQVNGQAITAPFRGVLRGLIRPGLYVTAGLKIGDLDPRDRREYCFLVSDKALAIAGGVLEAVMRCQAQSEKV